jgi:hypothetical protein
MSNENKERVIDVTASAQSNAGYWRVVKVDLEDGTEFKNEELFESREEADASCEKCQQEWKEHAWDNREYLSMEYQVRFVSMEEVAEEKRQKLDKWHNYVRKTFIDPIVPASFTSCCQKLLTDMLQKVDKLSKSDISKMRTTVSSCIALGRLMAVAPSYGHIYNSNPAVRRCRFGECSLRILYLAVLVRE